MSMSHLLFHAAVASSLLAACGSGPSTAPTPAAPTQAAPTQAAAVSPAAPVAAPASHAKVLGDYIVWYTTASGPEATWIVAADDSSYRVEAARPEAVLSNGTTLWALQRTTRMLPVVGCDANGDAPATTGADGVPQLFTGLEARPLGGGKARTLTAIPPERFVIGSYLVPPTELLGSVGATVATHDESSIDGCGAHPDNERSSDLRDVSQASREDTVFDPLYAAIEALARPADTRAKAKLDADCREHFADIEVSAVDVGVALIGGELRFIWTWALITDAHAMQGCGEDELRSMRVSDVPGFAEPPAAVARALHERGKDGPVGWAPVTVVGAQRESALAAFKDPATVATHGGADDAHPANHFAGRPRDVVRR